MKSRSLVARQSKVVASSLHVLFADSQQIRQFHDRRDTFQSQQGRVLLNPLERTHLRTRTTYRWGAAVVVALACFAVTVVMHQSVFRSIFSDGSLYSGVLLPIDASFMQLVQSAATPRVFGSGTSILALSTPWPLVLILTKTLVDTVLAEPTDDHDIDLVQCQLGRYPRGVITVRARYVYGRLLVITTRPALPSGISFPATCCLTGPEAVKAASHARAADVMQQYNDMLALDEELKAAYEQTRNLYLAFCHELAGRLGGSEEHIKGTSAGGMPVCVKCLYALLAQSLVMGPDVSPIGDLALERVKDEFDLTVCHYTLDD